MHGIFEQTPTNHINQKQDCPSCGGVKKMNTEEFILKSKLIHGDKYDYSLVEYLNNRTKVKIICKKHGEFLQKPNNHLNGQNCMKCVNSNVKLETKDEIIMRDKIKEEYCESKDIKLLIIKYTIERERINDIISQYLS
jgi:hypothetical protein